MGALAAATLILLGLAALPFPRAGFPRARWLIGVGASIVLAAEVIAVAVGLAWFGLSFVGDSGRLPGLALAGLVLAVCGVWFVDRLLRMQARALRRNLAWLERPE